ncbi:integrase [Paenibacillus sp. V4I9]|uniref:DUF255 domain-containing protein n=1 Tax=Paenibacillus sp. V4I9 TaxID=3042308 RepID=UPI002787D316|nr:DUF255 domain-containing protein [Paenibacillus sp. V4I9]MDQ0888952.1 integrase [Paenibacillus sp. V4I9]
MSKRKPNLLINEKSPYLLQHAYNPINWHSWNSEAFEIAKLENKPIFLSVGYSCCHWCHVMAHESFEDQTVADMLNKDFISIKVDREERPDVDHIYMAVCQAMTGQGGWPLTVFLTPEKKPFFAGTYFPRSRKYNRAGMVEIVAQMATKWKEDAERIREVGEQVIQETTSRLLEHRTGGEVSEETLHEAFRIYESMFDPQHGGFGNSPKFPTSHNLSFLLRYHHKTGNERALKIVENTLDAMHRGGMYDHIGFGFISYYKKLIISRIEFDNHFTLLYKVKWLSFLLSFFYKCTIMRNIIIRNIHSYSLLNCRSEYMSKLRYRFVVCNGKYFREQGGYHFEANCSLICLRDEELKIDYPLPISSFIFNEFHKNSGSINTELSPAKIIVSFLNFTLLNLNTEHKINGILGLSSLELKHANRYMDYCVKVKANKLITLNKKEMYISAFFKYLDDNRILKKNPQFKESKYVYGHVVKTYYKLDFNYTRTDETLLRVKIKRKDMVPQKHQSNQDRKIIRLNYIREFLLIAMEVAPDIAFALALQFYGGLRIGEVLNLEESSIRTLEGAKYGQRGMVVLIRDRQNILFKNKKSIAEEQVKNPRDQSILIDPIICLIYEQHVNKVMKATKKNKGSTALFYDSEGNPMSYRSFYKRYRELQSTYHGVLLATKGRFQDYRDFVETNWSSHIGRGAFTNMCLDVGFTARQTAILRGDKSIMSMESYKDQISATYNITRALGFLEPENAEGLFKLNVPQYQKYWNEVEKYGAVIGS